MKDGVLFMGRSMFRKKVIFAVVILFVACAQSCTNRLLFSEKEYDSCIDLSDRSADSDDFFKAIENIAFVPLEVSEQSVFRNADKVIVRGDTLYVGDFKSCKVIAFSTESGKFLFDICRRGRSNNEYLDMTSFSVYGDSIFVLDNMGRKVVSYSSKTGQCEGVIDLDFVAWDIEAIENHRFLLSFAPLAGGTLAHPQTGNMIITIDSAGHHVAESVSYGSDYYEPFAFRPFFCNDGSSILFSTPGMNGVMRLDALSGKRVSLTYIRFENNLPSQLLSDAEAVLHGNYNYLVSTPVMAGSWMHVEYSDGDNIVSQFVNTSSSRTLQDDLASCLSPDASASRLFYSIIDNSFDVDYILDCSFFDFTPELVRSFSEKHPVLVRYSLK